MEKQISNYEYLGIAKALNKWKKVKNGILLDHFEVEETINELNKLFDCSDITYHLTGESCMESGLDNCIPINTNNY